MPQRTSVRPRPTLFRKSCLATAIAALAVVPSACSTMPRDGDAPRGEVPVEAGLDTHDVGERNWNRMMYLLGFSEEAKRASREAAALERARGESPPGDSASAMASSANAPLLDEVDWALMEEDAPMPEPARRSDVVESASLGELAGSEEAVVVVASNEDGALVAGTLAEETPIGETAVETSGLRTGSRALSHEVGDSETLWDIAKATTGDATNWHVLADVNDLEPDAAVYPGQILTVPADLVRPELTAGASASTSPSPTPASSSDDALAAAEPVAAAALPGRDFELDTAETLWDLAKRATGDATNWRAIADANGFTDREASLVRPGQTITVPLELVREPSAERSAASTARAAETDADVPGEVATPESVRTGAAVAEAVAPSGTADDAPRASTDVATAAGDAARATGSASEEAAVIRLPDVDATGPVEPIPGGSLPSDPVRTGSLPAAPPARSAPGPDSLQAAGDEDTLRVVDAAYRSGTAGTATDRDASRAATDLPSKIMVSGTYYPKAVYNDADFSSSLLMRVSPGTTLQVSRAVGPWFEVQTEQGRGYVHTRDIK